MRLIPIIIFVTFIMIYIMPTSFAYLKNKHNRFTIMIINLIFGWTVIGWLSAFIWSLTNDKVKE